MGQPSLERVALDYFLHEAADPSAVSVVDWNPPVACTTNFCRDECDTAMLGRIRHRGRDGLLDVAYFLFFFKDGKVVRVMDQGFEGGIWNEVSVAYGQNPNGDRDRDWPKNLGRSPRK